MTAHRYAKLTLERLESFDEDRSVDTLHVFENRDDPTAMYRQLRGVPCTSRIMEVPVADLIATQGTLSTEIVKNPRSSKPPELILWEGDFYVVEGHHRIANAIVVKGAQTITATVLVYEQKDGEASVCNGNKGRW